METDAPVNRRRKDRAGFDCLAIDNDGAGAALRRVAADMRSGQAKMIAQELDEQRTVFDLPRVESAVDGDGDVGHGLRYL